MTRNWPALVVCACLACQSLAEEAAMVRLAGTPAEIGRTLGAMNKRLIAHDLDVDYLRKAAAQKISEQILIDRSKAFVRIVEEIAPHWLEEARAVAQAASVSPAVARRPATMRASAA